MKYETSDGVEFFVIPEYAKCMWNGTHPDEMIVCPMKEGKLDYDICICRPDLCDYYVEDDGYNVYADQNFVTITRRTTDIRKVREKRN